MSFNESQMHAIAHKDGPCMVLAGPGSGKTTVITNRIRYLIQEHKVPSENILVITFSKAAAKEMRERFFVLQGMEKETVTFGTFHGVYFGILKWAYHINNNHILSENEKCRMLSQAAHQLNFHMDDADERLHSIMEEMGKVKNASCAIGSYLPQSCEKELFQNLFYQYEGIRKANRKLDFDDMLVMTKELFEKRPDILKLWQRRYPYILIDEFQDINQVQYDVVRMLALPENNLFIVGDDDQSIYRFRGAKPEIMLHFPEDYPTARKILLPINYRSTKKIVDAAQNLSAHNQMRYEKEILAEHELGEDIVVRELADGVEESKYVVEQIRKEIQLGAKPSQIAVLYRTNMEAVNLAETAVEYHLPFQMKDSLPNLYEHFICQDVIAYMKMAMGKRDRSLFLKIMNRPNRYLGRESVETKKVSFAHLRAFYQEKERMLDRIDEWEDDLNVMGKMAPYGVIQYLRKKVGYDDFLLRYAQERQIHMEELEDAAAAIEESTKQFQTIEEWFAHIEHYTQQLRGGANANSQTTDAVAFMTMHSAKGLEFDTVFILGANEGVTPYKKAKLLEEIEEERRLFYVALTRARKKVYITHTKKRNGKQMQPSRFINDLFFHI